MAICLETRVSENVSCTSFRDLQEDILRFAREIPEGKTAEIAVELDHGQYLLTEPFRLSAKEEPSLSRLRLAFKAKSGMRPIVTGCLPLCGADFEKVAGKEYYRYRFPKDQE